MEAPMLVGDVATFLARLRALADGGAVALGIDCPVGLPPAYAAQLLGFKDFPAFLRSLTPEQAFFSVARRIDEVSLARPFFPAGSISGTGRAAGRCSGRWARTNAARRHWRRGGI
jgi:hypothetical protein